MKKTPKPSVLDDILKIKDPYHMFDMVCMMNYMAGQNNGMIPVDQSRKVFEKIKEILENK